MNIEAIQQALRDENLDGWLFFDHHLRDPLAYRVLGFEPARVPTRRWYYMIPANGVPQKLVHKIEAGVLDALPGDKTTYASWALQLEGLKTITAGAKRVAMQYSKNCAIPYVAMVDAGTIELVRSVGLEVVGSADLIQHFEARWSQAKLDSHIAAGKLVDEIRRTAFEEVGKKLKAGRRLDEYAIKAFILENFERAGLVTDHGPIVAVNRNASNPHYEPEAKGSAEIRKGDLVLIDLWAKLKQSGAVYYDITWTGYCGSSAPSTMNNVFDVVKGARDAGVEKVRNSVAENKPLRGFEVDDAARGFIVKHGYGEFFFHRTGHSIGEDVHGTGANMDNLETHDERKVVAWTCFSVEPGIYLPEFGIRSEVNVFVGDKSAGTTGEVQQTLVLV
jgi:Xaa-Pro dipeptidase